MQDWTATTRHGVTRKRNTKILSVEDIKNDSKTKRDFRKNGQKTIEYEDSKKQKEREMGDFVSM